jgi:hypothetical protein
MGKVKQEQAMSKTKSELTKEGPFPNHFDPWLEKGQYFHQFHAEMIGFIFGSIEEPLYELGYFVGREASIQISPIQPDLLVRKSDDKPIPSRSYESAVLELNMDVGVALDEAEKPELDNIAVRSVESKRLVTIIELISPANKHEDERIIRYQNRRRELLEQAIDVVEIDLTRSFKRLIDVPVVKNYPYHIAIHLYDVFSRFWGMNLEEPLKSLAMPVEDKVIPVDVNSLYRQTYSKLRIAYQMFQQGHYTAENLPFPTTISDAEREKLLAALEAWKEQVK